MVVRRVFLPMLWAAVVMLSGAWGSPESLLLEKLQSDDLTARAAASSALVQRGPIILNDLRPLLGSRNPGVSLWARRTVEQIVHNAASPEARRRDRTAAERFLLSLIGSPLLGDHQTYPFHLLSLIGGSRTISTMSSLLADPSQRPFARMVLERIPKPAATTALIRAVKQADSPEWKADYLRSLGVRGDTRARSVVVDALSDSNETVRLAALRAASRLFSKTIEETLWIVLQSGPKTEQTLAREALLSHAETSLNNGKADAALMIYQQFYQPGRDSLSRCTGLAGLARTDAVTAVPLLLSALHDSDVQVRGVAQDALLMIPGEATTQLLIDEFTRTPVEQRATMITLLGKRTDPAVMAAVPLLIQTIQTTEGEVRSRAVQALRRIPGREVASFVAVAIPSSTPAAQAALLEVLGNHQSDEGLSVVLHAADSSDPQVMHAAFQTLAQWGDVSAAPLVKSALLSGQRERMMAAVDAVNPIANQLVNQGKNDAAIDLCVTAAQIITEPAKLQPAVKRLQSLDAEDRLSGLIQKLGFVTRWQLLGPFPGQGYLQENDLFPTNKPVNLSKLVTYRAKDYRWRPVEYGDPTGLLNFQKTIGHLSDVGIYLYAEVESSAEQNALFKIGSDDDVFCWLNEIPIHQTIAGRPWVVDEDVVEVRLQAGVNRILMKVLQGGGEWGASLRITTPDGDPLPLRFRTN